MHITPEVEEDVPTPKPRQAITSPSAPGLNENNPKKVNIRQSSTLFSMYLLAVCIMIFPYSLLFFPLYFSSVILPHWGILALLVAFVILTVVCSFGVGAYYFKVILRKKKEYRNLSWIKYSLPKVNLILMIFSF